MRHRLLLGMSAVSAVAMVCCQAQAQWYIGGEGGWTSLENQKIHSTAGPTSLTEDGTERWDGGYNVGLRAGYQWGPWRFEEEYSYRNNGVSGLTITSATEIGGAPVAPLGDRPGANGSFRAHAFMTNAIYDFDVGWPVTPHLGAGIGAVDLLDTIATRIGARHGNDWEFGYQAIVGMRYNINSFLAFDLDYRYLATTDPTFFDEATASVFTSSYSTQNVLASLTLRFGQAPAPMALHH